MQSHLQIVWEPWEEKTFLQDIIVYNLFIVDHYSPHNIVYMIV